MKKITNSGLPFEEQEQIAFIKWVSYQPFKKNIVVIENGGSRSSKKIGGKRFSLEGARLKRKGVRRGVSDIFLAVPSKNKAGLWLEMKIKKGGRVSEEQKKFMSDMEEAGYRAVVGHGWVDSAIKVCDYLGVDPKGLL